MKIFITGAAGYIGMPLTEKLLSKGHKVYGLTRSEQSGEQLLKIGAEPVIASLSDLNIIRETAEKSDAIIHLAYSHDLMQSPGGIDKAIAIDADVIKVIGDAIKNTGKIFIGTGGYSYTSGIVATEETEPVRISHGPLKRQFNVDLLLSYSKFDVKTAVIRLPLVHSHNDYKGFIGIMAHMAKGNGFITSINGGQNHFAGGHLDDMVDLYTLVVENISTGGKTYHGTVENITYKELHEIYKKKLNLPIEEKTLEEASKFIGFFTEFMSTDQLITCEITKKELGWGPKQIGLIEDVEKNYTF